MQLPTRPVVCLTIRPKTKSDLQRLLQELASDSLVSVKVVGGGALAVSATAVLHLESLRDRLVYENKIEADLSGLTVIYWKRFARPPRPRASTSARRVVGSRTHGRPHYAMRFSHYDQALHPREPGDDGAGVTADLPRYPKAGSGSAACGLDEDVD